MSTPALTYFTQRTVLAGVTYIFTFRYNARMDLWMLDVADATNQPIIQGLPILTGRPVWQRLYNRLTKALPAGLLLAIDMTGNGLDAQLNTLNNNIQLFFYQP